MHRISGLADGVVFNRIAATPHGPTYFIPEWAFSLFNLEFQFSLSQFNL